MKRRMLAVLFLATVFSAAAQDKYANTFVCTAGKVHFFSATPVEDIEATNSKAICVLNTASKKIQAEMTISNFQFEKKLMQEHFNENYMESDKFPKAKLDGTIVEDIDFTKDGVYDITIKGTLEIHGVKQDREVKGKLTIKDGKPTLGTATFDVKLVDHDIKVPTLVVKQIAEVIKVDCEFVFVKYSK